MVMALTLILVLAGTAGIQRAAAQEPGVLKTQGKEGPVQPLSIDAYNVEFTVNELDNGKKINSRSYSMQIPNIPVHGASTLWTETKRLRMGSQVPTPMRDNMTQFHYSDVGMDIDCRILVLGNGKLAMGTNWNYSSLATEPGQEMSAPVIRHVRSEVDAVVPLDKPTVIAEVDDVASTHRFVFEVKVTKLNP
jgi:hypothetical protein